VRFAHPALLWLLLVLPVMALYLRYFRHLDLPSLRFSSNATVPGLPKNALDRHVIVPGLLRLIAVTLLIIAVARPQKGLRSEELTTKATDIMICLDASRSMLIIDFKPENRFEVAKQVIADFVKGRKHDRIGLVMFAEYAVTQCPLTTDRDALLTMIQGLGVGDIPPDRTAIGMGIATAVQRLKDSQARSKSIVLVTDGANNAGSIDPVTAAKTAASLGIKIYAIGAGTPEGGEMPVDDPLLGRRLVRVKSDLDEDTLLKVAELTGGKYFRAKSEGSLKEIFKEIDSMEKTDIKVREFMEYEELYWPFLLAAVMGLMMELGLAKTMFRTLP
jgi:Ca-activated chloride channel homolog